MIKALSSRSIAITDIEATGLDPKSHEIIEIGLLVIDQQSFQVIDTLNVKIKPERIETASQESLAVNGYKESDWQEAITLNEAMRLYSDKTKEAVFCAHNITFDWSFINEAFCQTSVANQMDYHRLDLLTMAWTTLANEGVRFFNLNKLASYLSISEEPAPHRAINGARTAYEVFKKLVAMNKDFERAKVCYEQNCQHMRSLNQIMWQVPIAAMTLTGGLWYAVATLSGVGMGIKYLLLLFAAIANSLLILVLRRVRLVMAAYMVKIKEFNPAGFAVTESQQARKWLKKDGLVANLFCALLGFAALMSLAGLCLVQEAKGKDQPSSQNKAPSLTKTP
jgi:DNA polymerase III epsilon subunit-like protein